MWWVEKLESANKLILFQNNRPVRNEHDVLIFIVAVSALQEDETGRNITVSFENGSSLQLSLDDFSQRDTSLKADLKAINFVKQFAKEFSGQLPAEEQPKTKKSGYGVRHVVAGCVVGVGAVAAAPFVLTAVGFTSGGIAAGSIASGMMSSAAIANGGAVAAGSGVAVLQSVGAAGLGAAGTAAVGGAGAAAGAGASGVAGFFQNYFRGRGDSTTENKTSNTTQEDDDYDNNGDGEDGDGWVLGEGGEGMGGYGYDWDDDND